MTNKQCVAMMAAYLYSTQGKHSNTRLTPEGAVKLASQVWIEAENLGYDDDGGRTEFFEDD